MKGFFINEYNYSVYECELRWDGDDSATLLDCAEPVLRGYALTKDMWCLTLDEARYRAERMALQLVKRWQDEVERLTQVSGRSMHGVSCDPTDDYLATARRVLKQHKDSYIHMRTNGPKIFRLSK